jgi:choice-of-anchor B domain-containing protein
MKLQATFLLFWAFQTLLQAQTSPTQNIRLRSTTTFSANGAGCWGYAANGREYAFMGLSDGCAVVDVTNADAPRIIRHIPAGASVWREVQTYNNTAYIVSQNVNGVQILDLTTLPSTNQSVIEFLTDGDGTRVGTVHSLHVDTAKGFLYLHGANATVNGSFKEGTIVLDLKPNRLQPRIMGIYPEYFHDGYAINDTLYGAALNKGTFQIIDYTNKAKPRKIAEKSTPGAFTHNTWRSDDGKTLFVTDESNGSFLSAYDVSDMSNVRELDRLRSLGGDSAIVHNTYFFNNFVVNAWYTEGLVIVDAARPHNLIQVGQYDTSPLRVSDYLGAWGAYPYLPSGNILISDVAGKLFVVTPQYKRACYLEGRVIDSVTRLPLSNVLVKINSTDVDKKEVSNTTGMYGTGQVTAGRFSVTYSKAGYVSKTVMVDLQNGVLTTQNMELAPASTPTLEIVNNATLVVSPNPTRSDFQVAYDINEWQRDVFIKLTNGLGQTIFSQKLDKSAAILTLNAPPSAGVYVVTLEKNGQILATQKLVKQ